MNGLRPLFHKLALRKLLLLFKALCALGSYEMRVDFIQKFIKQVFLSIYLSANYTDRPCQGSTWKRRYPSRTSEDIREFLEIFGDAFLLKQKDLMKIHPDDCVHDIYRDIYPSIDGSDSLEYNCFDKSLRERYGLTLEIFGPNPSVGAIFRRTGT